jgi:hypothetical protein
VVVDVEVGELGEDVIRREWTFDAELDLAAVSLEPVADFEADPADDHPDQMLDLKRD